MDVQAIERAAMEAIRRVRLSSGTEDVYRDVAKAIAAAIAEYNRQKSE